MFQHVQRRAIPPSLPELYRILERQIKLEKEATQRPINTPAKTPMSTSAVQTEVNLITPVAPFQGFTATLGDASEELRKSNLARETLKSSLTEATKHIDDLKKKARVPTYMFSASQPKQSSIPFKKPSVPVTIGDNLVPGTKRKERSMPRYSTTIIPQADKKQIVEQNLSGLG